MDGLKAIGWERLVVQNGALARRGNLILRSALGRQSLQGLVSSAGV
jgi:hypothetical protein